MQDGALPSHPDMVRRSSAWADLAPEAACINRPQRCSSAWADCADLASDAALHKQDVVMRFCASRPQRHVPLRMSGARRIGTALLAGIENKV